MAGVPVTIQKQQTPRKSLTEVVMIG